MREKYVARSQAIAARMLEGEMIVMSVADSTLFNLNPVGTVIWRAADGVTPLREIVAQRVCREFEIDPDTAYADATRFVDELAQHGILIVSDQPIPGAAGPQEL